MAEPLRVVHIGVIGNAPSGMAQVVNEYMSWSLQGVRQYSIPTTRWKHDPLAPALLARATLLLVVRRLLRRADTIAVHLSENGSFFREGFVVLLARTLGFRVVAHLHGADFETFASRSPRVVSVILRRASAVAVLTSQTKQITTKLAPNTPAMLVSNSVTVPPLTGGLRTNSILFAGEIGERKGVDILLAAWQQLGLDRADWNLHIVGPDSAGMMETTGPLPGLTYHGPLAHTEVMKLANITRVAVLPSRREALPMFLLESMARGNMPIGTPVGQVEQLISGVGLLVRPGDISDLTQALRIVCQESLSIETLAQSARARVLNTYSSGRTRDTLIRLWSGRSSKAQAHHD